jgi:hypothetical protein
MPKRKHLAVTEAARQAGQVAAYSPIGRAVAALRDHGEKARAPLGNGCQRSLQAVSEGGNFSALIRSGPTTIQIEGDGEHSSFAVTTHD